MTKAIFNMLFMATVVVVGGVWLSSHSAPECNALTPRTFIVSTTPYICDFTRGGGPMVP